MDSLKIWEIAIYTPDGYARDREYTLSDAEPSEGAKLLAEIEVSEIEETGLNVHLAARAWRDLPIDLLQCRKARIEWLQRFGLIN